MRTIKDFEKIAKDFYNSIDGKMGTAFLGAVFDFMVRHEFEHNIYNLLYETEDVRIMFFTDHIFNNNGFIFVEFITDGRARLLIANKKVFIQGLLEFIKKRG